MKKTLTVNLGGTVYHIDEDAYKLLDTYLSNLRIQKERKKLCMIWSYAFQNCLQTV